MDGQGQHAQNFATVWSDRRRSDQDVLVGVDHELVEAVVAVHVHPAASGVGNRFERGLNVYAGFAGFGFGLTHYADLGVGEHGGGHRVVVHRRCFGAQNLADRYVCLLEGQVGVVTLARDIAHSPESVLHLGVLIDRHEAGVFVQTEVGDTQLLEEGLAANSDEKLFARDFGAIGQGDGETVRVVV